MITKPITCVWEVTMGCNMRCGHCGSSCKDPLPDELTTEEALKLADEIGALGLQWVTLSGGEPTTRKDLPKIIERLSKNGVTVNIITNGWLMDAEIATKLKESGAHTVAISIDGTEKTHDTIRKEGSYKRSGSAIRVLKAAGLNAGVVTTVTKQNLAQLTELRTELIKLGADSWQLQIGLPMGNLAERPDWVLEPEEMNELIDFSYNAAKQGGITIYPADCIGYYTKKETEIRQISFKTEVQQIWDGCNAGVRGFGILQNGDILGCTSIRSKEYIEGNIKDKKLAEIWYGAKSFAWRRDMKKSSLGGDCLICAYGEKCLGGCPNTRMTMNGTMESENQYCAYNIAIKERRSELSKRNDLEKLLLIARDKAERGEVQDAALLTRRIMELEPSNEEALKMQGFAEFMCGNYKESEEANRKVLEQNPDDAYATRGLGLALHRQGRSTEGLGLLETAAQMTGYSDEDTLNDLLIVRDEIKQRVNM